MLCWRGPLEFRRLPIAVLKSRGTVRTRKRPRRWSGHYPPGSPAEWLAARHLLNPMPQRRLQAHGRRPARYPAPGSPWSRIPVTGFEPFPKSADLSLKRVVPYPPLPQGKSRPSLAGFFTFRVRSDSRAAPCPPLDEAILHHRRSRPETVRSLSARFDGPPQLAASFVLITALMRCEREDPA